MPESSPEDNESAPTGSQALDLASDLLRPLADQLAAGGVVAAATETFFGLLADATRSSALDALIRIKPRGHDKGIGLILPDRAAWGRWVSSIPPLARELADAFWPGPLTIALSARDGVDARLLVGGTVAVRVAPPCAAQELAALFGGAVTATSANWPGTPPTRSSQEVARAFPEAVRDRQLTVLRGFAPGGSPSTVVTVRGSECWVAREGAIDRARIEHVARDRLR